MLYEIGSIKPELIDIYVGEFVELLLHKDNRMVWGAMTTLGSIADGKTDEIWEHVDTIIEATSTGSVITQDWGVRVLSVLSASNQDYANRVYPFLLNFLKDCKPKDVPRHAESIIVGTTTDAQKSQLKHVLEQHQPYLKPSQLKRVNKVLTQL